MERSCPGSDELAKRRFAAGVDVGGTWVRVAIFDRQGTLVEKTKQTVDKSSQNALANQIITLLRTLCDRNRIPAQNLQGVGIASTGPLDKKKGELSHPVNLPFSRVPLTKPIAQELKVPTSLVNDCTGAVMAERRFGAGKGLANLVYITLGTGIGGGAIVDGNALIGKDGNAVEIGHLTIDSAGRLVCGCGMRGHWEAYCSGKNLPNFIRLRLEEIGPEAVRQSRLLQEVSTGPSAIQADSLYTAARKGDPLSRQLVEEQGILNAIGVANVINAYDPALVTVGGSVALKNASLVLAGIRRHVKEYALNRVPKITITPLGEDIGIYGGATVALELNPGP